MATRRTIPTYSSDGERLPNHAASKIEQLLVSGRVAVERTRKGTIVCATFRPRDGANPISNTAHMGQSYSVHELLANGHRAWKHVDLLTAQESNVCVRAAFLAVPLSVISKPAPAKKSTPVVCIDSYRRKKELARPVEFDSELRAA